MKTTWKIKGLPNWPNRIDVQLSVDTTAQPVIDAIELAAKLNGIVLERRERRGHV
jgi:hypothetical protein